MPPVPAEPKKLQRLLWISDSPKFLGVGQSRVTREVCDRWHGKDFDVSIIGFGHNQPDTPTDRDTFPYGIYPVERDDPAGMIRAIDTANPEIVVMSHDLFRFPNIAEAHAKHKNTTFVGYITVDSEQIVSEWRYLLESYTGLVVPSPFGKKEIHRQWFDLPVEVVPYGVNQTLYRPPKDGKAALKHVSYENSKKAVLEGMSSVNMVLDPRDKFCACFFGHNQLRKNVAALVEAWGDFATGKEDTFLYFSCHSTRHNMHVGYYPPHLLSRAENMVYIPNPGSDMDMGMVMAFSDVLLHPVLGEGFGLTIGEAMASGTVPITTNFSSMADLCDDTNAYMLPCTRVIMEGGLTICAPEVDGIVVALEQAYSDWKSGKLVEKAKAGIERIKPYTWNRCAESLKAVVEKYQRMRISKMSTIHAMRIA